MSTLAVNAVTDANGGNTATINSMTPTADSLQGFRNRIINGDMRIDQRNAGAAVSPTTSAYAVDRFLFGTFGSGNGRLTAQQSSTAPDGFANSLSITVSTADTSYSGTEGYCLAGQVIEGFNISDLGWGTANAKAVTLSFWVRSSVTGNFPVALQDGVSTTAYGALYTISSADTWEYKTITIPGATTGTWYTNNDVGIRITFGGGGKDPERTTSVGWDTAQARTMTNVTGATQLIATSGATWYITGVQLEVGSVATPFERRPYGMELILCQRYYYKVFPNAASRLLSVNGQCYSTTGFIAHIPFPVTLRIRPTALEQSGTASHYVVWNSGTSGAVATSVPVFNSVTTENIALVDASVASGLVAGNVTSLLTNNAAAYLAWSAEL